MSGRRAILLDLDGTLIDSAPDIAAALNETLAWAGLAAVSVGQVRGWIGDGASALLERAWASAGATWSQAEATATLHRFREDYADAGARRTVVYEGMAQAVQRWRDAGHPVVVCTNKPARHTRIVLADLGLADLFSAVVAGDDCATRKPHPEMLRHGAALAGAEAGVMVGDGVADIGAARAAGLPSVWVGWGYGPSSLRAEATVSVDEPAALTEAALTLLA